MTDPKLLGCAALISFFIGSAAIAEPAPGGRLFDDLNKYASFGAHRTGTPADLETSAWMAREIEAAGISVERRPFSVNRFVPDSAELITAGGTVAGFPAWFPAVTPPSGTPAPLVQLRADGGLEGPTNSIAWVDGDTAGVWHEVDVALWAERAATAGAVGLVLAIDHPSGKLYQQNAKPPHVQAPLPLPVLIVPASSAATIRQALGQDVTLRVTGVQEEAHGINLLGRVRRGTGPWVVVSTPTSGWFGAAGERGPGVALWLSLARAMAAQEGRTNYLFVAASGHELDYLGARTLLGEGVLPPPEAVRAWLHLGASIGTRDWEIRDGRAVPLERMQPNSYAFANEQLQERLHRALAEVTAIRVLPVEHLPESRGGELTLYRNAGYPVAGFVGSHRYFHTPRDQPDVTSPALLAPFDRALQQFLNDLSSGD